MLNPSNKGLQINSAYVLIGTQLLTSTYYPPPFYLSAGIQSLYGKPSRNLVADLDESHVNLHSVAEAKRYCRMDLDKRLCAKRVRFCSVGPLVVPTVGPLVVPSVGPLIVLSVSSSFSEDGPPPNSRTAVRAIVPLTTHPHPLSHQHPITTGCHLLLHHCPF